MKFLTFLLAVVTVVSLISAGCAKTPETTTPVPEVVAPAEAPTKAAPPKPGEWAASTGRSDFTFGFMVNSDSTGIPEYSVRFTEFKCEGVQTSGGWTATVEPIVPITGGQFTIETEEGSMGGFVRYTWDIVIQGKFDETGIRASGTWEISSDGTICSEGTWESLRVS